jgi:hypothetical protein
MALPPLGAVVVLIDLLAGLGIDFRRQQMEPFGRGSDHLFFASLILDMAMDTKGARDARANIPTDRLNDEDENA